MRLAIFHVLHLLSLLLVGFSSHFRGGTIQWKPFNGSINISYQFSWSRSASYCDNSTIASGQYLGEGSLYCYTGCNGYVGTLLYRCTAFSELEDWSYGSNEYQYNATGDSYFQLQFSSCCLLSTLNIGADGWWSLIVGGSLSVRNDTGRINSSPSVIMPPIVNVHFGCESLVRLDVRDVDGDFVRCRWASSILSECGGVCNALPNSNLLQELCVIILQPNILTGMYPVAIQVEDFARRTDTIPLSSVPLLFLVNVVPTNTLSTNILPCGDLPPIFTPPTPPNGICIPVLKGQSWTGTLLAQRQSYVTKMSNISVTGATSRLTWQNDSHISVEITWSDSDCRQMQSICFSANDSMGVSSGIKCFTLLVMKNDGGIEVTAVSDSAVLINWTHMKPAQLGFNVSLYRVLNNSNALVSTKVMDGCAQSTQFNGIDGGTPYQVIVFVINELNIVIETLVSATFFSSQKAPRVPPYGVNYFLLPGNLTMVKWTSPTLMDARGFIIGYTVLYICYNDEFFESKLFEANTTNLNLSMYNNSEVTCSIQVCSKTVAGCGPLSLPVLVQVDGGIEVTALTESVVLINWTHMKPAQLRFNVSLYRVLNNSIAIESTNVIDGPTLSTKFDGIDGGTPYQVIVSAINQLNMVTETIISATFFSSQKAPRVPPYGVEYLVLPSIVTMVKWTQPTLMDARGFVIGYTVFYICNKDGFFESKLFEANTTYLYIPLYNNSEVTCSVQVCSKTVAGCGPLSLPVLVQEKSGPGFQNNADSYGENQIYSSAIYGLTSIFLLVVIYSIGITIKLFTMRAVSAKNMPSIKIPEVQLVECNAYGRN